MAWNEKLPEWNESGAEPPQQKKDSGWQVDEKPPAGWFNWLLHRAYKALQEIRARIETAEGNIFSGNYGDLDGVPDDFTPKAHKDTHATGGADALTPGDIGAETPDGAAAKATAAAGAALDAANDYTDQEVGEAKGLIGTLAQLATTVKANIVAAINEIVGRVDDVEDAQESHEAEKASKTAFGHVKVGDKLSVANGVISADNQIISPTFGKVTYTDTIPKKSTLTKNINIGANKTHGIIVVDSGDDDGIIFFTTTAQEAKAITGGVFYRCRRNMPWLIGQVGTSIELKDAYISGNNLVIVFEYTGSYNGTIDNCNLYWEAW